MTTSKSWVAAQRLSRHRQGKHFQKSRQKNSGTGRKGLSRCPYLRQIFFRNPIPADAERTAPFHDFRRDLGQVLLAEAGVPEVGVKAPLIWDAKIGSLFLKKPLNCCSKLAVHCVFFAQKWSLKFGHPSENYYRDKKVFPSARKSHVYLPDTSRDIFL